MIIERPLKISNYKCFDSNRHGFERIFLINVIVGKNSSGKSSLIDLVGYSVNPNQEIINVGRNGKRAEVIFSDTISQEHFKIAELRNKPDDVLIGKKIQYTVYPGNGKNVIEIEGGIPNKISLPITGSLEPLFAKYAFKRIIAERDIVPENNENKELELKYNGGGTTSLVRHILLNAAYDTNLIKKHLLKELNKIINPDISFNDIHIQTNDTNDWEIYFDDADKGWIALSKMGSGIKTILLTLINLIVIPDVKGIAKEKIVFGFEELENNLHPAILRRLFNYIIQYAEKYKAYFFITTHSSIVIDLFNNCKIAQLLHVQSKGSISVVQSVLTNNDGKNILKDLEVKASDILLSNGVIWFEGPSDAIYIELLLDLYKDQMGIEDNGKLNYTIQTLSTAIWKYAGFKDFDWSMINENIENKIISLAAINHNHLIVLDKDDNYEDKKPSEWEQFSLGTGKNKARLIHESMKNANQEEELLFNNYGDTKDGLLYFWVNDGTFETYLEYFINNTGKEEFAKYFGHNKTGYLEKLRDGENSSISKVELAANIADCVVNNGLRFEDFAPEDSPLRKKIASLYRTIKSWN